MAIGGNRLAIKYLDPDLCYAAWVMAGAVSRARKRLADDGIVHPISGEPPSKMGIVYAAKESMLYRNFLKRRAENPSISATPTKEEYQEAIKIYKERIKEQSKLVADLRNRYAFEPLGT